MYYAQQCHVPMQAVLYAVQCQLCIFDVLLLYRLPLIRITQYWQDLVLQQLQYYIHLPCFCIQFLQNCKCQLDRFLYILQVHHRQENHLQKVINWCKVRCPSLTITSNSFISKRQNFQLALCPNKS